MKSQIQRSSIVSSFLVIVFAALCIQLLGRYHAKSFVLGRYFYVSWILLRIVIPIILLYLLKIPFSQIGLGLPKIDKKLLKILIIISISLLIAFIGIYFLQGYFDHYSGSFHSQSYSRVSRFINFFIFTSSTLTGWEFLHRGFLLMGIFYLLSERDKIHPDLAMKISIAVVWVFEVVFHFIKPELEALGLLIGSPILSYLAFRTRSIWVPFFIHLLVEFLFIFTLIMR